jgi:hypothetical protein
MTTFINGIEQAIEGGINAIIGDLTKPFAGASGGLAPVYYAGLPGGVAPPAPPTATDQPTGPTTIGNDIPWADGPPNGETDFNRISTLLQGTKTRIVYIGVPDTSIGGKRRWWDLRGNYEGAQGLMCCEQFAGLMHAPFDLKVESGAYQLGGTWQRTDWGPKQMSMSVLVNVGVGAQDSFGYRMLEDQWWNSWADDQDGYLGVFTRTHGWRFFRVRLNNMSKTAFEIDPTANDNNFMQWDMEIVALYPFAAKKSIQQTWQNTEAATSTEWNLVIDALENIMNTLLADLGPAVAGSSQILGDLLPGRKVGAHVFSIANKSTTGVYPKYIVSSPGIAWIQNGWNSDGSPQMLQLPLLTPEDGYVLVDTDPDARTLTCATDPADPLFMQILSNVSLLEILLGPIIDAGKPIWQQFKYTFTEAAMVPPRTVANLHAWHSQHNGTITCIMPQFYKMAWG